MSGNAPGADERAQDEGQLLVLDYDLEASPGKLWRAIVEPALASRWLGEGERQVVEADPERRLTYRWREADAAAGAVETLVTFEITANPGGGAHLRILHRVAEAADGANDNRLMTMGGVAWAA